MQLLSETAPLLFAEITAFVVFLLSWHLRMLVSCFWSFSSSYQVTAEPIEDSIDLRAQLEGLESLGRQQVDAESIKVRLYAG